MTSIKNKDILNCIDYSIKNKLFDKLNDVYKSLPVEIVLDVEIVVWSQ